MIQETYCSFEQAKALKELGFPQESFVRYVIHEFNTLKDDITTHKNVGEIFHLNYISDNPNNLQNYCTADRQTLSLVQKWLREDRGIDIVISVDSHGYTIPKCYVFCVVNQNKLNGPNSKRYFPDKSYDTYEQALSAGIDKCIQLLTEKK